VIDDLHIIRHIVVRGRVQGIGFRAFVEHHAVQRGLAGWVRNRRDGSVEAVFVGTEKSVQGMIEVCSRGPQSAQVDTVDQREGNDEDFKLCRAGDLFSVLPTA
jgi:acylphosphatase